MKIHISQTTKDALDDLGGFEVELRGMIHLKVYLNKYLNRESSFSELCCITIQYNFLAASRR
jgi:hypothetical protein